MEIEKLVLEHWEEYLLFLRKMIQIPSFHGEKEKDAPYGKGPKEALNQILAFGKKFGFEGKIIDDVICYLQWGEDNEDYIGIVGHLDVVPAGDGWHYPPFDLTENEGYLYGRGILDNKGPITSCLFGMYLLKQAGYIPKKTIRIIFGSDEEVGMREIPVYLKRCLPPTFGFTPDCKYPVVYGERGVVTCQLEKKFSKEVLVGLGEFTGDKGRDHVSDYLEVPVFDTVISAKGKRTPTNAPELGESALTGLLLKLGKEENLNEELRHYFDFLATHFHHHHFGEGVDLELSDEDSGRLILTPIQLEKTTDSILLDLSIRYPVSFTEKEVVTRLTHALKKEVTVSVTRCLEGIKKDKNDPRILKLAKVYQERTGLDGTPVTTTGGTYARKMPNIVAFGPSFPGQKGIAHKADEWMKVDDLKKNMEIYMASMVALTKELEDTTCLE